MPVKISMQILLDFKEWKELADAERTKLVELLRIDANIKLFLKWIRGEGKDHLLLWYKNFGPFFQDLYDQFAEENKSNLLKELNALVQTAREQFNQALINPKEKETPLHKVFGWFTHENDLKNLIRASSPEALSAALTKRSWGKQTPLHDAMEPHKEINWDLFEMLVEKVSQAALDEVVVKKNDKGKTPLTMAAYLPTSHAIEILISKTSKEIIKDNLQSLLAISANHNADTFIVLAKQSDSAEEIIRKFACKLFVTSTHQKFLNKENFTKLLDSLPEVTIEQLRSLKYGKTNYSLWDDCLFTAASQNPGIVGALIRKMENIKLDTLPLLSVVATLGYNQRKHWKMDIKNQTYLFIRLLEITADEKIQLLILDSPSKQVWGLLANVRNNLEFDALVSLIKKLDQNTIHQTICKYLQNGKMISAHDTCLLLCALSYRGVDFDKPIELGCIDLAKTKEVGASFSFMGQFIACVSRIRCDGLDFSQCTGIKGVEWLDGAKIATLNSLKKQITKAQTPEKLLTIYEKNKPEIGILFIQQTNFPKLQNFFSKAKLTARGQAFIDAVQVRVNQLSDQSEFANNEALQTLQTLLQPDVKKVEKNKVSDSSEIEMTEGIAYGWINLK